MLMFNPSGVDKVVGFVPVGFIPRLRDYSRGGPLWGHNHSTFYTPNSCAAPGVSKQECPNVTENTFCVVIAASS